MAKRISGLKNMLLGKKKNIVNPLPSCVCYIQHYSIDVQRSRFAVLCNSNLIHRWRCNRACANFHNFLSLFIMTRF